MQPPSENLPPTEPASDPTPPVGHVAWPPPPAYPYGGPPPFGGPPGWAPPPPPAPPPQGPRPRGVAFSIGLVLMALVALVGLVSYGGNLVRGTQQGGLPLVGGGSQVSSDVTDKVNPAVVDILSSFPDGLAAGTGMVISSSGEVLTNNHVVDGATSVQAQIGGVGVSYDVKVLGLDPSDDIALLQIENVSGLQTVQTADSSKVSVGDAVVAIGNALGRQGPPTAAGGHVTALNRTITAQDENGQSFETLAGLIEVDANVVPGDSGGPLVNADGKVIGMDTAASARRFRIRTSSSQGYAIPINTAMEVAQRLRNGGSAPSASAATGQTALLGVQLRDAATQGGPGALVVGVQPGSPADQAGIVAGDVIVSIDGQDVQSASDLRGDIRAHRPGDRVEVGWVDGSGGERSATVRLVAASG